MQTISETTPNCNPHGKNVYRARQTERPGWRPRKVSPRKQALYIAESIQVRIAEGRSWSLAEYGIEGNADMIALVNQHLQ